MIAHQADDIRGLASLQVLHGLDDAGAVRPAVDIITQEDETVIASGMVFFDPSQEFTQGIQASMDIADRVSHHSGISSHSKENRASKKRLLTPATAPFIDDGQFARPTPLLFMFATRADAGRWCEDRGTRAGDQPMLEDILVLGFLTGLTLWTYVVLPLLYHFVWT
jgi:hypothetical protein